MVSVAYWRIRAPRADPGRKALARRAWIDKRDRTRRRRRRTSIVCTRVYLFYTKTALHPSRRARRGRENKTTTTTATSHRGARARICQSVCVCMLLNSWFVHVVTAAMVGLRLYLNTFALNNFIFLPFWRYASYNLLYNSYYAPAHTTLNRLIIYECYVIYIYMRAGIF